MATDPADRTADPTRIVADADVLAADLLCGGRPRAALDRVWQHTWLDLVVTEPLLDDAAAVIAALAADALAADWRETIEAWCVVVDQPPDDHPALAAAYRGRAAHVLSFDERLQSAQAGVTLQDRLAVSVRSPHAFLAVFDPRALYESRHDDAYRGPDRPPRNEAR